MPQKLEKIHKRLSTSNFYIYIAFYIHLFYEINRSAVYGVITLKPVEKICVAY